MDRVVVRRKFLEGVAPSMDRVVVRRATPDDYDAIIRISEGIYDGYDYVPDIYFKCLEDPNRCMQVAEWNGKVVSIHTSANLHSRKQPNECSNTKM